MKQYKAVLFDMDGVIVDSMHWHAECWLKVFQNWDIELTKDDIFIREGMSGIASIIDIFKYKGYPVPENSELELLQKDKIELFETAGIKIFPLSEKILEFIRRKNLKMGLVTGSPRRSVEFMLPKEMLAFFDAVVAVEDTANGKPHPDPYLNAMNAINTEPDKTLVVENAPLGIASAKAAGTDCFAVETTLDRSYLKEADMIFKNQKLLLEYLKDNL